jgi:ABC-2 type transport system ATP-binding protein
MSVHGGDLLKITGLAKRFTGGGLCDVSLSVPQNSITGFIGANGAGKSTTLRCVLGLLRPDAGEIRLFGAPADASARNRIGFLPEERGLFPYERPREAIAFHGRLKGLKKRDALKRADDLLARMNLGSRANDRVETLSKGNVQRVHVLCALVHQPQLLLLDEPLSGLDPVGQAEMLSLIAEFRNRGGAVLFSTHSMAAAESICDRVVMLAQGRTVFEGALPDAAALAPHGAVVVTADAMGLANAVAAVQGKVFLIGPVTPETMRWRVVTPEHVPLPALIRTLAEYRVPIENFQPIRPGLEGAFWHLAEQRLDKSRAA